MNKPETKKPHPFELMDKLKALRGRFEEHRLVGVAINADGLELLLAEFGAIETQAREFMNELSAHRWNQAGRIDRADDLEKAVLDAIHTPGTNVRLFAPETRRFTDGRSA